jgi:hypothetical protein
VILMSTLRLDELPAALWQLQTRPLFVVRLDVKPLVVVGDTPGAFRRVGIVTSGTFAGERLSGKVLDGSNDWQDVRTDGSTTLDVRLTLQTDDSVYLTMAYRGVRHGPTDVMARLDRGEAVDPAEYYFRTLVTFEASAGPYAWLNGIVGVGIGHRFPDGPVYSVFEVQ